jgi:hypothetical protein
MSVETTVNTIVIRLMNNSGTFQETETSAETVGELRASLGLDGTIVVNNQVAAEDSITLRGKETDDSGEVTYPGDRVSHVSGNKRGGKVV